jgi:hypothetical protein
MEFNVSDYRIGALVASSKVEFEGLLVSEPSSGFFEVLWSDGITYPAVKVQHFEGNEILRYLTEKEILAWRIKHGG